MELRHRIILPPAQSINCVKCQEDLVSFTGAKATVGSEHSLPRISMIALD